MRRMVAGLIVAGAAVLGLGLGVNGAGATVRALQANHPKPSATVAAHLLTLSSLPAGWRTSKESPVGQNTVHGSCLAFLAAFETRHSNNPWASRTFAAGSSADQWAEILYQAPNALAASALYATYRGDLAHCHGFTVGSGTNQATVTHLNLLSNAPQSSAYAVSFRQHASTYGITVHVFRVGTFAGGTVEVADNGYASNAVEQAQLDALAVKKIQG
jgi:hypothetical protein